jgi:hypothetical protein
VLVAIDRLQVLGDQLGEFLSLDAVRVAACRLRRPHGFSGLHPDLQKHVLVE